jgi:hypothetical protein
MSVERAGIGLALLADLIAAKKLRPQIAVEAAWSDIGFPSANACARVRARKIRLRLCRK